MGDGRISSQRKERDDRRQEGKGGGRAYVWQASTTQITRQQHEKQQAAKKDRATDPKENPTKKEPKKASNRRESKASSFLFVVVVDSKASSGRRTPNQTQTTERLLEFRGGGRRRQPQRLQRPPGSLSLLSTTARAPPVPPFCGGPTHSIPLIRSKVRFPGTVDRVGARLRWWRGPSSKSSQTRREIDLCKERIIPHTVARAHSFWSSAPFFSPNPPSCFALQPPVRVLLLALPAGSDRQNAWSDRSPRAPQPTPGRIRTANGRPMRHAGQLPLRPARERRTIFRLSSPAPTRHRDDGSRVGVVRQSFGPSAPLTPFPLPGHFDFSSG